MRLTIAPTDRFETIERAPCRVWTGTTESGTPVQVWVRCVAPQSHDADVVAAFERALRALPPARKELVSFDYRFIV